MGLWFLVIPILIVIFLLLNYRYEEINIVKHTAISITIFWILFSVLAGIYFMFDAFGFATVLVTELAIVSIVLISLIGLKGWKAIKVSFEKERDLIILGLLIIAFLLTNDKFELFCAGQDQGLYQIEALELYMGNYEVQHDFEEYQILEDAADKEAYYRMLDEVWVGYYPLSAGDYTEQVEAISEVSGMYHGVQTFPAMLALAGRLFGMEHMMQLQTILYLCSIALLYYTMCDMKTSKVKRTFLTMIFILSPLALWISKATYTEMVLCLMITFYCYLLFEENEKKWMMSLPLIGFSFIHMSFLMVWPIFWIGNVIMYVYKENKHFLYSNIINAVGVIIGYAVMIKIAPEYTFMNLSRLFLGNVISHNNIFFWIVFLLILSCIISAILLKSRVNYIKSMLIKIQSAKYIMPIILGLLIVFWITYGVKIGYYMAPEDMSNPAVFQYYGKGLMAFTHLTIYACALATGFIILPCIIGCMFFNIKEIIADEKHFVLTLFFMYIVMLQSVFLRKEIFYYYYYSRYLLYFIPIICLMAAVCIEQWKKRIVILIACLSIGIMLYFDFAIIVNKDDTMLEWENLIDVVQNIDNKSAVIICGEDMQMLIAPQVRTLSGASVFPLFDDFNEQMKLLQKYYDKVYLLSEKTLSEEGISENCAQVVYKDQYQFWRTGEYEWGVYPIKITPINKDITLYEVVIYELGDEIYFATQERNADRYVIQGLSHNEQTFAWTVGKKLEMRLWFNSDIVGTDVDAVFEVLYTYNGSQEVQVFVNDQEVDTVTVTSGEMLAFEFEVPQEVVNIELVFPNAISPQELGESMDDRKLALGLVKATFY